MRLYDSRSADPSSYHDYRGDSGLDYKREYQSNHASSLKSELEGPRPARKNFYLESQSVFDMSKREVEVYRRRREITVEGKDVPNPVKSFDDLELLEHDKQELETAGITEPTPIQAQCWPMAFMGRDLIGIAETGSGKTLAYLLPAIIHATRGVEICPKVLVLAPTRELVLQIQQEFTKFGAWLKIYSICIYRGVPKGPVARDFEKGVEVVVATPESLLDMLQFHNIDLRKVTCLVLDDADRMLDMGFEPQIQKIFEQVHPDRYTSFWSATWSEELEQLAQRTLFNPCKVIIGSPDLKANHAICQHVDVVSENEKYKKLVELLEDMKFGSRILIFVDTKQGCDQIFWQLDNDGWPALTIHEDMYQADRDWVLSGSSPRRSWIMIATDLTVHDLDVEDVNYVINYDFPGSLEDYVHRIRITGRTKGTAYTFFTAANARFAKDLINILEEAGQKVNPVLVSMGHGAAPPPASGMESCTFDILEEAGQKVNPELVFMGSAAPPLPVGNGMFVVNGSQSSASAAADN